jgi:hypothetical protein
MQRTRARRKCRGWPSTAREQASDPQLMIGHRAGAVVGLGTRRQAGYGDLCVIKDGEERLRQRLKTTLHPAAVEREVRQMVICALLGGLQQVRGHCAPMMALRGELAEAALYIYINASMMPAMVCRNLAYVN